MVGWATTNQGSCLQHTTVEALLIHAIYVKVNLLCIRDCCNLSCISDIYARIG